MPAIGENANPFQIAVAVESCDLPGRQPLGMGHGRRMKAQVALYPAQLFSGGDELWGG
jgi:hypothetical protein